RNEDLIDFSQHVGIFELQNPSALRGIVDKEDAETACSLGAAVFLSPNLESNVIYVSFVLKVVGVKDQRFAARIKDAAGKGTDLAGRSIVSDVHNAQIACGHEIANVFLSGQEIPLAAYGFRLIPDRCGLVANRCGQCRELPLLVCN